MSAVNGLGLPFPCTSSNIMSRVPSILSPTEEDIQLLLSAQCHIGTKNANVRMAPYIYKRRADGINLINIGKTWEKLIFAARVIAAIENPQDIVVVSARPYGHRAALKFARYIGAEAIVGRFTPGTFTNYITRSFREPRLIICQACYWFDLLALGSCRPPSSWYFGLQHSLGSHG
ncbi:hypothetical protein G6F52_010468 [Rhizopus delemar]|nr:hypothetical protein G6F52_010468 [Rhizopus delemar]